MLLTLFRCEIAARCELLLNCAVNIPLLAYLVKTLTCTDVQGVISDYVSNETAPMIPALVVIFCLYILKLVDRLFL